MKKGLIFFLFCLICEEAFAGVFSVIPTDKSQEYLGMVFGGSVGSISLGGGNNPTLSLMFERFNFIIVAIGAVVLSYIGVLTTINTAREGQAMGQKMSLWVPLRAFSGMLLMVPGPTSGYSVVQMTVMWLVLNGIGAANAVWNVVLGQLAQNVSAVGGLNLALTPSYLNPLSQYVLQASTCMNTINNYMPGISTNAGPLQNKSVALYTVTNPPTPAPSGTQPTTITQTANVFIGVQGAAFPVDRLCGVFTITSSVSQGDLSTFNYATVQQRLSIKTAGLQAMFSALDPAAQLLANPSGTFSPPDPGYIYAAGQAYISQITQLATGVSAAPASGAQGWEQGGAPINPITGNYATLKSYGWIGAGSFYFTMVKASGARMDPETIPGRAVLPTPSNVPNQTTLVNNTLSPAGSAWPTNNQGASALGDVLSSPQMVSMSTALQHAFSFWTVDQTTPAPPSQGLAVTKTSTGNDFLDAIVNGIRDGIQTPILNYVQSIASGSGTSVIGTAQSAAGLGSAGTASGDPLVSIGQFGGTLMLAAEITVFLSIVTSVLMTVVLSAGSCLLPFAWMAEILFIQILPLIYGVAVIMWTLGATLGIYIPLVPYLVFTMTAFGWIIQVIEAVVAAPIIALGLIHPGGEELGKAGSALSILANIFLKPTLMIFGFVLGASLLRAGIALVNFGFIPAITEGAAVSVFSIIAILGMYVGIITAIVNKSFSLIYVLPNQIMRWMGGGAETSDTDAMVKEAKGGMDTGAGAAQKGVQQGLATSTAATEGALKKYNEKHKGKPK
jgi:conjugal transfer/type IV secretion protein DotA/TraY